MKTLRRLGHPTVQGAPPFSYLISAQTQLRYAISYRVNLIRADSPVLQFKCVCVVIGCSDLQHEWSLSFDMIDFSQVPPILALGFSVGCERDRPFQYFQLAFDVAPEAPSQFGQKGPRPRRARCYSNPRRVAQPRRHRSAISRKKACIVSAGKLEVELHRLSRTIRDRTSGMDREDGWLVVRSQDVGSVNRKRLVRIIVVNKDECVADQDGFDSDSATQKVKIALADLDRRLRIRRGEGRGDGEQKRKQRCETFHVLHSFIHQSQGLK